MIIDTHAHLMFPDFKDDLVEVFDRARNNGVEKIINVGCGIESSEQSVKMAAKYEALYATVGLHPYDAEDIADELMDKWTDLANKNQDIVAIGECGLDYLKSKASVDKQKECFRKHLELAHSVNLPVIVHNRGADDDCLEILREFPKVMAVFHCYGSDLVFAKKVWGLGYMTSFTGIITFPNAKDLCEVVKVMPMDKFMVETDCPYLAPQGNRGKRNEPSFVVEVVEKIAELKGLTTEKVADISTANTLALFGRLSL